MSGLRLRTAACLLVLASPACVIRLTDRNEPAENGAITGLAADCNVVVPEARGAPGGAAEVKLVGRFDLTDPNRPSYDWSGNYIQARFMGDLVTVDLDTEENDLIFTAVVDDLPPIKIRHIPKSERCAPGTPADQCGGYEIARGLDPNVEHQVTLHRNSEALLGPVQFLGFNFGPNGKILPPIRRPRRIEIIGDSITCGYGNEGENATCPFDVEVRRVQRPSLDENNVQIVRNGVPQTEEVVIKLPITENQYLTYSALAARALDADIVTLCWSGKGVAKNYKERALPTQADMQRNAQERASAPEGAVPPALAADCDSTVTVPELWLKRTLGNNKTDPEPAGTPHPGFHPATGLTIPNACAKKDDKNPAGRDPGPVWDFSKEKPEEVPQVVVINLGTNDFARDSLPAASNPNDLPGDNLPDGDIDRVDFRNRYRDFVLDVRKRRPNAHIILTVPPMVTDQFPLDNARTDMKDTLGDIAAEFERNGDLRVYRMELVEQGVRYGLGCDYHPNLEVHRIMAAQLEGAIRSKTCW